MIAASRVFLIVCLIALATCTSAILNNAFADIASSARWFSAKPFEERTFLQGSLILLGHYRGLVDGIFGKNTHQAIVDYERSKSLNGDGILTPAQEERLITEAAAVYNYLGFSGEVDRRTGIQFPVPTQLFTTNRPAKWGTHWESADGSIEMETLSIPQSETTFATLFDRLSGGNRRVEYSVIKGGFFVVSGRLGTRKFYTAVVRSNGFNHGFSISWAPSMDAVASLVSVFIASMAEYPEAGSFDGADEEEASRTEPEARGTLAGSGFAISTEGTLVTNAHVVENCEKIEVPNYGEARLLVSDAERDLAVIRVEDHRLPAAAEIQIRSPELGQAIVMLGYPLSDLMGNALSVSTGIISSLSGIGGDKSIYTLSANVQPGNSGGPVLDRYGNVVGVAVAKLNETKMLEALGTTGGSISFAINAKTLLDFLGPFKASTTSRKAKDELSVQNIVVRAKNFTHQIICRN